MHEGLGQVAPQLALADVVFLGVQAGRAAGRAAALESVRGRSPIAAHLRHLGQPETAQQEGALGLVQCPAVVAEDPPTQRLRQISVPLS